MKATKIVQQVVLIICFLVPSIVSAGALEDYENARKVYLFAAASRAAYSDRIGDLVSSALQEDGWDIDSYFQPGVGADARFLLAKKANPAGSGMTYLIAVSGTETLKDVMVNMQVGQVYFAGKNQAEFAENAVLKTVPLNSPAVHKGFYKYVETVLKTKSQDGQGLVADLLSNPANKVYLVGHSLGGAAVTLSAACLLNMGVAPEQIGVVTFGAPAVGNSAFSQQYETNLHVTRIVNHGDPVPSALKDLVGGYRQFGRQVTWKVPASAAQYPHSMDLYLDLAIKDYYAKKNTAQLAGLLEVRNVQAAEAGEPQVYVAPVVNSLPPELQGEFPVMREALLDQYRDSLPGYVIDAGPPDSGKQRLFDSEKVAGTGSQLVIVPEIQGYKVRDAQDVYYVTLQQTVYQVADGRIVSSAIASSNTRELTPLEALLHNAMSLGSENNEWLERKTTFQ